jgi:hypothetical protein
MPTMETNLPSTTTTTGACPLCGAPLNPQNPSACEKCDWTSASSIQQATGTFRDRTAVALSVIPGLGHIYKGHRLSGALYMMGAGFAIFAAIVASTATAGFGILLLPLYWLGVMLHVFYVEDLVVTGKRRL